MVLVEKENEVPPESAMPNRAYLQLWHSTRVCAVADTQALHTPSALRLRALLRNHPIVVQALEAWWMAALHTMRGASRLDMSTYVLISKNLYKAVVEEWDEEDATENAFSEWNDEAAIKAGATTLSPSDFMDGMFELADIHTEHIDWEECRGGCTHVAAPRSCKADKRGSPQLATSFACHFAPAAAPMPSPRPRVIM